MNIYSYLAVLLWFFGMDGCFYKEITMTYKKNELLSSNASELALRLAMVKTNADVGNGSDQITQIRTFAVQGVNELTGSTTDTNNQNSLQAMAITVAIKGLVIAYSAVNDQLGNIKNKRLAFDKEIQANIASCTVPINIEGRYLSLQERVVSNFIDLVNKNPTISKYFGIHKATLQDGGAVHYYSTIPLYSVQLNHYAESDSYIMDEARKKIQIFLSETVSENLNSITKDFEDDSRFIEFWKSLVEKNNYLNPLRVPRFVVMCLANLLWHLQYPVDSVTGVPLGMSACIEVCEVAKSFLNHILNEEGDFSLKDIHTDDNQLLSFTRKMDRQIRSLIHAFEVEKKLGQLNINDLCNNARFTLKTMDKSLFELIYSYYDPTTKKREQVTAATGLINAVNNLTQLIQENPALIKVFQNPTSPIPGLNETLSTVMDVIIIFTHCNRRERNAIYSKLAKISGDSARDFNSSLQQFYNNFIEPIRKMSKQEKNSECTFVKKIKDGVSKQPKPNFGMITAKKLMPLISLLLDDYQVDVELEDNRYIPGKNIKYSANQQVRAIIKMAEKNKYYQWSLPLPMQLRACTELKLTAFIKQQHRFSQLTKLLEQVHKIVNNYRNFLQNAAFHQFLKRCLDKVKEEFNALSSHIKQINSELSRDNSRARTIGAILDNMTGNLNSSLKTCMTAVSDLESVISDPEFIEKQKQILSSRFKYIHSQYNELFNEDSGISSLITDNSEEPGTGTPSYLSDTPDESPKLAEKRRLQISEEKEGHLQFPTPMEEPLTENSKMVESRSVILLCTLAKECLDAMSCPSRRSQKGENLQILINRLAETPTFTPNQFRRIVKELAGLTMAPRSACFFQAKYADTRSAKPILRAMIDPKQNDLLSLSTLILGDYVDLSQETEAHVQRRIQNFHSHDFNQGSLRHALAVSSLS